MSFNKRLFSTDDFTPKRKNGKKNGKNGARRGASGFESPGFFGGLKGIGDVGVGTRAGVGEGLEIPALGDEFNTRFGKIGTGFVENVDTFKVGFKDVTSANGRSGSIIGGGFGGSGRKRGRPKGSGKKSKGQVSSLFSGSKKTTKGIKIGKATIGGSEGKTVAQMLGSKVIEKTDSGFRKGVSGLRRKIEGTPEGFESEKIDLGEATGRGMIVTQEGEGSSFSDENIPSPPREGGVTFADSAEDVDVDMTDADVEEADEEILDEDMEKEEDLR